jgi:hypothetical protein
MSPMWIKLTSLTYNWKINKNISVWHQILPSVKVKVKVTLRLTVGQPVSLDVQHLLVLTTSCLLLFDGYCRVFEWRPLWREVEVTLQPTVSRPATWCQAPIWDPRPILLSPWIFFRHLWVCNFVAPSLTRGRVCNLLSRALGRSWSWSSSCGRQSVDQYVWVSV